MRRSSLDRWLPFRRVGVGTQARLFCFPHAGGGGSFFRAWSARLPSEVEVCAVQLPGRENRLLELPITRLPDLIPELAEVLLPAFDLSFAFFGHSLGALIAFELARQLRRCAGPLPLGLFVSGRAAPHLPWTRAPIHSLPEAAFLARLRQLRGTPREILDNRELMEILLPRLRADFQMGETYLHVEEEPLDCALVALGGRWDPDLSRRHLGEWGRHTRGPFRLRRFPGGHFFLDTAHIPVLRAISKELRVLFHLTSESAYRSWLPRIARTPDPGA